MTEHPGGVAVDVHNVTALHNYNYTNDNWMEGFRSLTNPAHETTGPDGVLWSTVVGHNDNNDNFIQKVLVFIFLFTPIQNFAQRFVYKVDPVAQERLVVGSFEYPAINITEECTVPGVRYPDPEKRSG